MSGGEAPQRGLPSISQARVKRTRGSPAIPPRFLLWTAMILVASSVYYWRQTQAEVESQKAALFARQRGILTELGPRLEQVRGRVEQWTIGAAGTYPGDFVAPALKKWDFATLPGLYLRLRVEDAASVSTLRKAARQSLRDGFTACLFREPNGDPSSGPPCKVSHECAPGTFCNEVDHCMPPAQPYNLRTAYHGTRVLDEEWTVGLRTASDDMQMRLFGREFESAVKDDIPLVVDLLTRAQFFLLVLDEDPANAKVPPNASALESIQALPHAARVFLFGLKSGMEGPLLRLRREASGQFVMVGASTAVAPQVIESQQRQVNSCQLALEVRKAVAAE